MSVTVKITRKGVYAAIAGLEQRAEIGAVLNFSEEPLFAAGKYEIIDHADGDVILIGKEKFEQDKIKDAQIDLIDVINSESVINASIEEATAVEPAPSSEQLPIETSTELADLQKEYLEKSGKDADGRWGVDRRYTEIAALEEKAI